MNTDKALFAQLMDFLPWTMFTRIVEHQDGDRSVESLTRHADAVLQLSQFRTARRLELAKPRS